MNSLIWKRGTFFKLGWLLLISVLLTLGTYFFEIGGVQAPIICVLLLVVGALLITAVFLFSVGRLSIQKSSDHSQLQLRMLNAIPVNQPIAGFDYWWSYNFSMFSNEGYLPSSRGPANQIALWLSLQLESGEYIVIRQVRPNWAEPPAQWKYSIMDYQHGQVHLGAGNM
jgi:hypothetical protein